MATHNTRKPQSSASIEGKPTLNTCGGMITIMKPVLTSKEKFTKAVGNKFVNCTVKESLQSQGTFQRKEQKFSEPQDLFLDTMAAGRTLRKMGPSLPFTFKFNMTLKPEDWKDMDQVLQLHQPLKELFQWIMENKSLNLESHLEKLGESCHKIFLKEITFKDIREITKGWHLNRYFRLLEERGATIRGNRATIKAIEEQLNFKDNTPINSPSQGVVVSRRREESKGKKKPPLTRGIKVRPHDLEAVGISERNTQEHKISLNTPDRISSPTSRNDISLRINTVFSHLRVT
ncbi:hypothetical protein O181_079958 [Austropuccinia psidii MF-1]|uniref:Uncharacterized protein n=1 Tax=Austropuccinia psidii MF-1 TaxID=1389203 RepID=A0A9Q3FHS0_9BASI|nr:hypothetical protein [Austropuccinia psidii MF-1]